MEKPGVCQAMNCPKHGHPLEPCDCTDNQHFGKLKPQQDVTGSMPEKEEKKWWQIWK